MSKSQDGVSIHNVLSLMAQNEDVDKLCSKLEAVIENLVVRNDEVHILTKVGTEIVIKHIYGDYNLYIHPLGVYELEDNPFKLYSLDRIKYYLNLICDLEIG